MTEDQRDWSDANPYYLLIFCREDVLMVDLGVTGWIAELGDVMRSPGHWYLIPKAGRLPTLAIIVHEGEQPYYVARHIGVVGSGGGNELTVYGIGKKKKDGNVERLWALPNGHVCAGDDVDEFGRAALEALGPATE